MHLPIGKFLEIDILAYRKDSKRLSKPLPEKKANG